MKELNKNRHPANADKKMGTSIKQFLKHTWKQIKKSYMANTDSKVKMQSLKRTGLKAETGTLIIAAQNQNLFTKNYQGSIR